MTTLNPPAGLVILHGLPQADIDPFVPFEALLSKLTPLFNEDAIHLYNWTKSCNATSPFELAMAGTLGSTISSSLTSYLKDLSHNCKHWIILGYSSGGWGIYDWLASHSACTEERPFCIAMAITIGSPNQQQFRHAAFRIGGRLRHFKTNLWKIPQPTIVQGLCEHNLFHIYSLSDETVHPDNARFMDIASNISLRERLKPLELNGVPHDALCSEDQAVLFIVSAVEQHLSSLPSPSSPPSPSPAVPASVPSPVSTPPS